MVVVVVTQEYLSIPEAQVFKEHKLLKVQQPINWDEEELLHWTFTNTIQMMQNEEMIEQWNYITNFDTN